MRRQIIAIVLTTCLILFILGVVIVLLNPFKTLPRIHVNSAVWDLNNKGYTLRLNISTTSHVQLVGVEVGGLLHELVYDVKPPTTVINVPTQTKGFEVKLHFNVGNPITVHPTDVLHKTQLGAVFGNKALFIYGVLSSKAVVVAVPVPTKTNVLVISPVGYRHLVKQVISKYIPEFTGDVVEVSEVSKSLLSNYTTLVFTDVAPTPELLEELVNEGKAVVLHVWTRALGQTRVGFSENGTVVITEYSPDKSDIDYFGAHCTMRKRSFVETSDVTFIKKLLETYKYAEVNYVVVPSQYCLKQFKSTYITTEEAGVAFGLSKKKFYFVSIDLKYVLILAMSGFFEGVHEDILTYDLQPFRGVKSIIHDAKHSNYLITVFSEEGTQSFFVEKPPISFEGTTITLGIDHKKRVVWEGTAKVTVLKYTYSMNLLSSESKVITLPASVSFEASPFYTYVIHVNNTPVFIIADEVVLREKPLVEVEYTPICEFFFLTVKRKDTLPTPVILTVNGRKVTALTSRNNTYELRKCIPMLYEVIAEDVYGNVIKVVRFKAVHIYESPLFILALLSITVLISTLQIVTKRKVEKEVEEVKLVLYKLPEVEHKFVSPHVVANALNNFISSRKKSPWVAELIRYIYMKYPVLRTVADTVASLRKLLKDGDITFYSRYVPELDDTLSIVHKKGVDIVKEFYNHVITEILKKLGGVGEVGEKVKEVVDADYVAVVGNKMIYLTYAPTKNLITQAISRGLKAFIRTRRLKLPFKLIGVAVVTEGKYVATVNRIIDEILNQNEVIIKKVVKDVYTATKISSATREEWLRQYIICAVPITRLSPLFAFSKRGAVRICNKYFRFLTYY